MEQVTAKAIQDRLQTRSFGRTLSVYGVVDSTNDIARELGEDGTPEGTVVLARRQTGGRGRHGRGWISPEGGLWLSIVLRPSVPADGWPLIGLAAGVGAAMAIETISKASIQLKWPNDLMLEERKVGGVLVESTGSLAIVGIGINANFSSESLPETIRASATTLQDALGRPVDLSALAQAVLEHLERLYDLVQRDAPAVLEAWRTRSFLTGRRVAVSGAQMIEGIAEGIADDGALLIRTGSGVHPVRAAGISIREASSG